jgi:hypothetical protein
VTAPTVQRVRTDHGSHIEPPLDQTWDKLTKLRWHLAVTLHDGGLPPDAVQIVEGDFRINGRRVESYDLMAPGWTASAGDFHDAWSRINGIADGLRLARRAAP